MKKIHLSIPKPCHESWDAMTSSEKGRFCASCQKAVIDFTNMSERQVGEFFKKSTSSVCGRFYEDQLNKTIELPKKRIPWIRYFFQITLPAFLVSMKANAQKSKVLTGDTTYCTQTMGFVSSSTLPKKGPEAATITGQIVDADGNKVPFASVMIKGTKSGAVCDADGRFGLKAAPMATLVFSAVGYKSKEITLNAQVTNLLITFERTDFAIAGKVIFVGYTLSKKSKPVPLIKRIIDTAFKKISVYPNPVQRNSSIKIDVSKPDAGTYTISLISSNGDIIKKEERDIDAKNKTLTLSLRDVAAGTYFIHLFNRKTAASYSEKIIVE